MSGLISYVDVDLLEFKEKVGSCVKRERETETGRENARAKLSNRSDLENEILLCTGGTVWKLFVLNNKIDDGDGRRLAITHGPT